MQVNNTTPSFKGGFYTPAKHINGVIENFKLLSTKDLKKCEQVIYRQQNNPNTLELTTKKGAGGLVYFFNVNIKGKNHADDGLFTLSTLDTAYFFKRIGKLADKLRPKRLDRTERKIQNLEDKLDLLSSENARKRGLVTEDEQRTYLLDSIKNMISKK